MVLHDPDGGSPTRSGAPCAASPTRGSGGDPPRLRARRRPPRRPHDAVRTHRHLFITVVVCILLWESGPVRPAFDRVPQQPLLEWQLWYCPAVHVTATYRRPGTLSLKGHLGDGPWLETLRLPDSPLAAGVTLEELESIAQDAHAGAG